MNRTVLLQVPYSNVGITVILSHGDGKSRQKVNFVLLKKQMPSYLRARITEKQNNWYLKNAFDNWKRSCVLSIREKKKELRPIEDWRVVI